MLATKFVAVQLVEQNRLQKGLILGVSATQRVRSCTIYQNDRTGVYFSKLGGAKLESLCRLRKYRVFQKKSHFLNSGPLEHLSKFTETQERYQKIFGAGNSNIYCQCWLCSGMCHLYRVSLKKIAYFPSFYFFLTKLS